MESREPKLGPTEGQPKGTLVLALKSCASDVKIRKRVAKQLDGAGIEWGMKDDQLVITHLSRRFISVDPMHLTRFGETTSIELTPGQYKITSVNLIPSSSLTIEKQLYTGAFFNEGILNFELLPGRTTSIEFLPVYQKHNTFWLKWFVPELKTTVIEDGVVRAEAIIDEQTSSSIPWDQYSGPLKLNE